MTKTQDITISKGSYSVTIPCSKISETFKNKITTIIPPTTTQNQADGPKDMKVVDLLMITHNIIVYGYICGTDSPSKTADTVKGELISIFKGAGVNGTPCSVTYNSSLGSPFNMYIENMTIDETPQDEPDTQPTDMAKYDIQLSLVEGIKI